MKQLTSLAILFVIATLVSFKAPPAVNTTSSESVPFSLDIFISCANGGAGEMVHLEGALHILTHTTINGNNVSQKVHFQPQGVQGTGLTTGLQYNATGVTQQESKASLQNGQ